MSTRVNNIRVIYPRFAAPICKGSLKCRNPIFKSIWVGQEAFVGKGIVLGDEGSSSTDSKLTVEAVKAMVSWTNKVAAL